MHFKKTAAFFLALGFLLLCCACSGLMGPQKTVSTALDALKSGNLDTARRYMDYDQIMNESQDSTVSDETLEMNKRLFAHISYKLSNAKVTGNTATVDAEITNTDMSKVLQTYFSALQNDDSITEDQMGQMLKDLMDKDGNETQTKQVTVTLTKKDNEWYIQKTDDFADAITGGYFTTLNEIMLSLQSAGEE